MKDYSVMVFGKEGCDKCKILNKRLDSLLEKPGFEKFDKTYHDITTVDGLVNFAKSEVLNPQRIPAFLVLKKSAEGKYDYIREMFEEGPDKNGKYRVPTYLGLQTDYSNGGVIRPSELKNVLNQALKA